tara:strand:+ start:4740 stop:5009 length:270 start_codon:yes stop_codon:yes gene_type:complete
MLWIGTGMPKDEGKHDKTSLMYTSKKRGRFVLLNYLNLFIDIPIVAEVERFRSTAASLLSFQAQRVSLAVGSSTFIHFTFGYSLFLEIQ